MVSVGMHRALCSIKHAKHFNYRDASDCTRATTVPGFFLQVPARKPSTGTADYFE